MGWYRNNPAGQYKTKVAEFMSTFARGLPEEHAITMEVSVDGQSWYAWRRTVSGRGFRSGCRGPAAGPALL